jgi:hypothetical protein
MVDSNYPPPTQSWRLPRFRYQAMFPDIRIWSYSFSKVFMSTILYTADSPTVHQDVLTLKTRSGLRAPEANANNTWWLEVALQLASLNLASWYNIQRGNTSVYTVKLCKQKNCFLLVNVLELPIWKTIWVTRLPPYQILKSQKYPKGNSSGFCDEPRILELMHLIIGNAIFPIGNLFHWQLHLHNDSILLKPNCPIRVNDDITNRHRGTLLSRTITWEWVRTCSKNKKKTW